MSLWQSSPMHWQTYTTSMPLTPQLEEAFRRQSSLAFRHSPQTMGYSVSSSFTSHNGIISGTTQLQVGKSTPWTSGEVDAVERFLVGLVPHGDLIGPSGKPIGLIEPPPPTQDIVTSPRSKSKFTKQKTAPSMRSFPSTVSEAGSIPPSQPPQGMTMTMSPTSPTSNHVHYEDQAVHPSSGGGGGRFTSITRKFRRKSTST